MGGLEDRWTDVCKNDWWIDRSMITWHCYVTRLIGKERTKHQQNSLVYVDRNEPISFKTMMAVSVHLGNNVTNIISIL